MRPRLLANTGCMPASPQWDLARAERIAAHLVAAKVPAFAEAYEDDVYLSLPVYNWETNRPDMVTVWWNEQGWQVDIGSRDGTQVWASGSPGTHEELSDVTIAGLLLEGAFTWLEGEGAWEGPERVDEEAAPEGDF